jgi:hypothetical protein
LVRRFAAVSAVVVVALITPSPAAAAAPCWKKLINDWYDNGRIDQVYALHCYREALDKLPEDVETYSSLSEDIERALAAAIANRGSGGNDGTRGGVKNGSRTVVDDDPESTQRPDEGFFREAFDRVRPRNADSVPLPLMILGGLALLLVAAGAAGLIAKQVQARRVQLGAPGAPPDDEPGA